MIENILYALAAAAILGLVLSGYKKFNLNRKIIRSFRSLLSPWRELRNLRADIAGLIAIADRVTTPSVGSTSVRIDYSRQILDHLGYVGVSFDYDEREFGKSFDR